jgi:Na+/H+ antiporter NhaD/arsenite permease-like protein
MVAGLFVLVEGMAATGVLADFRRAIRGLPAARRPGSPALTGWRAT